MAAGYDGSIRIDTRLDAKGFNTGTKQIEKGLIGITGSLKKLAGAVGLAFGTKAIIDFGRESVKAATGMTNAMRGLQSVMEGQGRSFSKAKEFIDSYIEDGLVPATNAINAYKNLALRGYDDSQIQQVLIALKDAAAFGRQASYTLGEAVETATEGLKNENSILVDNAGVTKNVAKMWEDYAKSIGVTTTSLTKQQKIQAEVLGILEETRFQTGDAAKIANSFSGELLRLSFNFNNLRIAIGNALIPLAQAVLPSINAMITGLTRLANVFAQVTTAIFGKQVKVQEQMTKTATSAAKAETALGNATEKAGKKAKNALAGFDELNVLAKNTAEDMNSVADSIEDTSFGGIDVSGGEIGSDITVSPRVQAAVDTFLSIIEPLQSISFDNAKAAFDRLKEAVAPFKGDIFAGLEWAFKNILVPLTTWAIEDALPVFLDLLSGSIKLLSEVIDALKPAAGWLWDNFLHPIAEWTGGLIVSVLEDIAVALSKVSDWISENEGLVRGMTITVGLFFAAWEVSNLLVFMTNAGGVIGIIRKLTDMIKAATVAKIASRIVDLKIVALYAKDFIVSFTKATAVIIKNTAAWVASTAAKTANTAAQLAMNVAATAWNGICAIATGVTTAFGAAVAFLTSPIGLVVIAITALIAIIVLLVKHWDEVKAAASKVWTEITRVWGAASSWFSSKVIDPIKNGFKGAINFLIGLAEGFVNGFIKGINAIIGALNKISIDVPNGVPFIGGTKFGVNIQPVKTISIPRLATGAVIPPNSEFLAVLGDQRSGRNLEAPEDLIRQIVREESGNSEMIALLRELISATREGKVLVVDQQVLGKVVNKSQSDRFKMAGNTLIPI